MVRMLSVRQSKIATWMAIAYPDYSTGLSDSIGSTTIQKAISPSMLLVAKCRLRRAWQLQQILWFEIRWSVPSPESGSPY